MVHLKRKTSIKEVDLLPKSTPTTMSTCSAFAIVSHKDSNGTSVEAPLPSSVTNSPKSIKLRGRTERADLITTEDSKITVRYHNTDGTGDKSYMGYSFCEIILISDLWKQSIIREFPLTRGGCKGERLEHAATHLTGGELKIQLDEPPGSETESPAVQRELRILDDLCRFRDLILWLWEAESNGLCHPVHRPPTKESEREHNR
jgi:hypothetical protein